MKKLFIAFAIIVCAVSAQASYLYWAVNADQVEGLDTWDTATFYQISTEGEKTKLESMKAIDGEAGPVAVNLGDLDLATCGYNYYIELVNSSASPNTLSGYQYGTYASLASSVTSDLVDVAAAPVWHGASSYSAPEPTSAMLMLLGVAGLALRRKQRKIA